MPQTCIYLDEYTMGMARRQAKSRDRSLSRHLADLVQKQERDSSWPESFFTTFGALSESDLEAPARPDWSGNAYREGLFS